MAERAGDAPAAAEGADLSIRLIDRLESHKRFCPTCQGKRPGYVCQWEQGLLNALEIVDAARPAPAAAPREGDEDALAAYEAWQARESRCPHPEHHNLAGDPGQWFLCTWLVAWAAAREAARGEGEGTALLRAVQWAYDGECPRCVSPESTGHDPDCDLGNYLARRPAPEGTP